jgi:plastocyanin
MNRFVHLILVASLAATSAGAGNITGRVHAEGKAGAAQDAQCGLYDSKALKFAEKVDYDSMRDFVVYIEGPVGTNRPAAPEKALQVVTTRKISQKKATFSPHVLPVLVGTTVEWPNYDDIFHNVFSCSDAKQFDLGFYKDPVIKSVTFDKPGRVDVFCSIHASMNCIILVLENPYFAATDGKGAYTIANVPAGTYKLKAWHERLPSQVLEITVPDTGEVREDFTLGIVNLPQY